MKTKINLEELPKEIPLTMFGFLPSHKNYNSKQYLKIGISCFMIMFYGKKMALKIMMTL